MERVKVKYSKPLIYPLLKLFFPALDWNRHIITWGDTIYTKNPITPHLQVHEEVHVQQFRESKLHFFKYLFSRKYGFEAELEAFRVEYQYLERAFGIKSVNKHLARMAQNLSSSLYKNIISYEEAIKKIIN